jgi:hypothetical protein
VTKNSYSLSPSVCYRPLFVIALFLSYLIYFSPSFFIFRRHSVKVASKATCLCAYKMCLHAHRHTHAHAHTHTNTHTQTNTHIHTQEMQSTKCVCTHIGIHMHTHTQIHTHKQTHTYTHRKCNPPCTVQAPAFPLSQLCTTLTLPLLSELAEPCASQTCVCRPSAV